VHRRREDEHVLRTWKNLSCKKIDLQATELVGELIVTAASLSPRTTAAAKGAISLKT